MAVRLLISIVAFLISCGGAVIRLEEFCHVERGRCNWRGRESIASASTSRQLHSIILGWEGGVIDMGCAAVEVIMFEDGEWISITRL